MPTCRKWIGPTLQVAAAVLVACLLAVVAPPAFADDMALWHIVDTGCAADLGGGAPPGLRCERARGYAVLKDRCGPTHFLVIPTARRRGVESPELLQAGEPNYFAAAWDERGVVARAAGVGALPDGEIGLAINSRWGRSQSQLHIHIDRLRPEVRQALDALAASGTAWPSQLTWDGHPYRVDRLASLQQSPFLRLAAIRGAESDDERARETLAVASNGQGGFYLLSDSAQLSRLDRGHAEELLIDRHCGD